MSATNGHVLGDVASFVRGITFTPEDLKPPFEEGTAVCMRTKNVQVDLDEADLIAVPKEFVRRKEQYLSEGDLLVSSANSWNLVGKCCWVPKLDYEATAGGFISILRADRKKVEPRYLYHWFAASQTQHEVRLCGRQTTNISNLNYERCLNLPIPLPKLEEQKRIAAILDKADVIRRKRQEAAAALAELREGSIRHVVGDLVLNSKEWPTRPLSELVAPDKTITYGILKPGDNTPNGVPMLRIQDIKNGQVVTENLHRVTRELSNQYKRTILNGGEIVISLVGTVGLVARVPNELKGGNVHRNLGVIVPTSEINTGYLHRILASKGFVAVLARSTKGGVQALLNIGDLNDVRIPIPPRPVQDRLDAFHCRLDDFALKQNEAVNEADGLFNSLVQRAFKGEL